MKNWRAGLLVAAALCIMPLGASEAAPNLPEDTFQWVQSTARQSYYFNKAHIHYGVKPDGYIDLNKLVVPTVRIYDAVQVQDVISKRRWNSLPLSGYRDLAGMAEYIEIDMAANTVQVTEHVDLDNSFGTLSDEKFRAGESVIDLSKLSDKDVEGKFYKAVMEYAAAHQDELIARTPGTLSKEDDLRIHMTPEQMLEFRNNQAKAIAKAEKKAHKMQLAAEKARAAADAAEQKAQQAEEAAAQAAAELAALQNAAGN